MIVIDADGHYVEVPDDLRPYVDPAFRDQAPAFFRNEDGDERMRIAELLPPPVPFFGPGDIFTPRGVLPESGATNRTYMESAPGGLDPHERLKFHDREGIDASILFPSVGLMFGGLRDIGTADALARGLNRWLAEFCSVAPNELFGVANLPGQDPDLAAAELRRAVTEHGFVAGMLRPNPYPVDGGKSWRLLGDPALEPVWATAEELDVAMCIHEGTVVAQPSLGQGRVGSYLVAHALVHPAEMMLAFGTLFDSGVFERHPRLRVGFMEANAGWAPFWLSRLDEHCETMGWSLPHGMERMPSEIFREQCWIGCEGEEWGLAVTSEFLGPDRLMWASDYPHFDAKTEGENTDVVRNRTDLSPDQLDSVLGGAASQFYKLDVDAVQASVARRRGIAAVT